MIIIPFHPFLSYLTVPHSEPVQTTPNPSTGGRHREMRALLRCKGALIGSEMAYRLAKTWHKGRIRLERATWRAHAAKIKRQKVVRNGMLYVVVCCFKRVMTKKRLSENLRANCRSLGASFRLVPALTQFLLFACATYWYLLPGAHTVPTSFSGRSQE